MAKRRRPTSQRSLLTYSEAAEVLGISRQRVQWLVDHGRLTRRLNSGRQLVHRSDLAAYDQERQQSTASRN